MSDPKSDAKADARTGEVRSESWIEAGLKEIARTGVEGVRVEVLAKNLGVTKGGFYRRFRDRAALLEAMLQDWSEGRIAAIEKHTSLDGATARERLKGLIALYSERMNTEGMAVELAIRQWARSDEARARVSPPARNGHPASVVPQAGRRPRQDTVTRLVESAATPSSKIERIGLPGNSPVRSRPAETRRRPGPSRRRRLRGPRR